MMREALLLRLQNQPAALDHLLYGFSEEQLRTRPLPDKWSVFENLAHLARYQEIFAERMVATASGTAPVFNRYKAEDDDGFYEWQAKFYPQLMADMQSGRAALNQYLASLSAEQLQMIGGHPVYGAMNVEGWAEFFLLHEAHHLFTILRLTATITANRTMGLY